MKENEFEKSKEMASELIEYCQENGLEVVVIIKPKDQFKFNVTNSDCSADMGEILWQVCNGLHHKNSI